ncbi:hypothetical protein QDY71_10955 [Kingella negevensis]|uniref:Uncharacterized protein n=1 Tax=Kingella negevensis TaxID=1522312 RepID=A0A238TDW5_9NEIS|nr:hypothetical protein [Kingella negevensis]MDK4679467.1 hypothetical protein [Kingella negevensis]MDK4682815.1 hypothetical protein [Kingella negevensis]MDK4684955.1 hypothetical protein [Kingella negevensis]MDK4691012.1 hypothetical protein [Kingella negevensis]MDK4693841.1 hypothetical protein [Kingella negevensis]
MKNLPKTLLKTLPVTLAMVFAAPAYTTDVACNNAQGCRIATIRKIIKLNPLKKATSGLQAMPFMYQTTPCFV